MKEEDGVRYTLPHVKPSEAHETLSVFLSMDGSFTQQTEALCKKTAAFGLCLQQSCLTPTKVWTTVHTTLWKQIKYPMEAITLSAAQWHTVLKPIMTPLLHSCGFVCSFKYDVLFGPPQTPFCQSVCETASGCPGLHL